MKKLFTFLLVLMASSCLWASITYNLNDGDTGEAKYNDYGWNNKSEMFAAFMTDAGATGFETLEYYMRQSDPLSSPNICAILTNPENAFANTTKWQWLKNYIKSAHTAQSSNGATALDDSGAGSPWRYAVGAFFVSGKRETWPKSANFSELGKDAAYIPAWGQNYGNPTDPTEEVTLVNPHRVGYIFGGWYDNPECTGTPITTVNASTTGTLYAKWVLDGIVYELNGGKYNDYGWTCKADICLDLEADYNATYNTTKDWVKKEGDVIKYCVDGTWVTEEEAKGSAANIAGFIHNNTWTADGKFSTLILTTKADKYGWLKDMITANREAQSIITGLNDAAYRQEVSAFFLCSPTLTVSGVTSSSYESTGDYEDYQPYWGQAFPNPEHPTAEVVLNNPVKEGYQFGGWYKEVDFSGSPITTVDQNFKGTLYAKWTQSGIVYELNGGVWNQYGWESKDDMYSDILKDINNITPPTQRGTDVNTITLAEDKTKAVSKGIPTYWSDLTVLLTHVGFNEKWGWLITYMDEVCEAQGKDKPSSGSTAALRYNLGAFFVESDAATYLHAQYGTLGKDVAYLPAWGQSYGNPEHPTTEVELYAPIKPRHTFEGWYDNAECTGTAITTVDENYAGTLYAKWSLAPVLYNLNGGQYNEYGWESKKDVYDDFIADWNTYSGTTRKTAQYEDQLGVGKSNGGIPTTITTVNSVNHRENLAAMFTNPTYSAKWGWLATYIDAVAVQQGKTQPTSNANTLTFSLGNFFGEDNGHATDYIGAVDFTGEAKQLYMAQAYCSFTLPNPMYPTKEVTLNNPTKEGYIFDGWYAAADFSGAAVTKVNANTKGTLYAKWKEDAYTRDVTNGNYGTICLPKGSKQTSGAIFYKLADKDAQYVYLEPVTILEAGVPYIFKATSNTLKVVYNTTEVATAGNHNGLYGTFVDIQDAATSAPNNVLEGNYLLVSNTIKKCGVNCKVLANRAYIKLEEIPNSASAAPGRNRVSMKYEDENEATGLDNITEDSNIAPALQGTYDIMGRKLTEPSTTGFYIVNGKKVIIMK